jgi:hypothetical protein
MAFFSKLMLSLIVQVLKTTIFFFNAFLILVFSFSLNFFSNAFFFFFY